MSANYAAGEFKIEAFTLVNQYNESLDLTNMVMGFKLFESIFNKFVLQCSNLTVHLYFHLMFRLYF